MLEIKNVRVYDLKESVISCRNAMRLDMPEYTDEEFEKGLSRAIKLAKATANSYDVKCHDNFMTGIRVSFDMKYTQYITKQFQRYHWFDYVSSSSLMHRITKMDFSKCCNMYVSKAAIDNERHNVEEYNKYFDLPADGDYTYDLELANGEVIHTDNRVDTLYRLFMRCISDCPMGAELFVHVSTNYKQLQTIYHQRKNHKLKEDWGTFCKFVEELPYSKELITG